jgi:WD40 repeat protein
VKNTSLPESNSSDYLRDKRYLRPLLVRGLRWLLIHWWFLPLIVLGGLAVYLLIALYFHVLLNQLLFLAQHWWVILLLVVVLLVAGIAIYYLKEWAEYDDWNEKRELERRKHAEAEREGYLPDFHLRHILQGRGSEIFQIAWSPDGRTLASGSGNHVIRLWDADSGESCAPSRDTLTMSAA